MSMSNDEMEGRWIRSRLLEMCKTKGLSKHQIDEVASSAEFLFTNVDALGFCLSEDGDLLSQWRGYADDAQGVSIGFSKSFLSSKSTLPQEKQSSGYSLKRVSYGGEEGVEHLDMVVDRLVDAAKDGAFDKVGLLNYPFGEGEQKEFWAKRTRARFPLLLLMGDMFGVKNPAFLEEKEWRLISLSIKAVSDSCRYRGVGSKIVPYREYPFDFKRNEIIERVILGPRNQSRISDVERMLEQYGFGEVKVTRSVATYRA